MSRSNKPHDWIVVGIGGVTCGGKTTLASLVAKCIHPSYLLHQDTYFYPDDYPGHVRCEGLDHNNYDILSSLDMARMHNDILKTMKGETANIQMEMSTPTPERVQYSFPDKKVLIVEGFSVLNYKPIADLCDVKYFITLEYGDCQARRVFRTYVPPDVPGYFDQCVWPNYLIYKEELEADGSVRYLDGMDPDLKDFVIDNLKQMGLATKRGS